MRALAAVALLLVVGTPALAQRDVAAKHFDQAEAYMKAEQYALAAAEYEKAYAALPKAGFLFNIGLAYERAGDARNAMAKYREYVAADPGGPKVEEAQARATRLAGAIADEEAAAAAEEEQRRAQEAQRARVNELLAASVQKRSTGDVAGAIEALREAHELTKDPERLFDIAELHREAGNAVDAKVHYEGYVAAAPTGPRHLQSRKHIEALAAELAAELAAAAVPEPQPPGPWSVGLKLGPTMISASVAGANECEETLHTGGTLAALFGYRFRDHLTAHTELALRYRPIDVHCSPPSGTGDADIYELTIPAMVGIYLARKRSVQAMLYGGPVLVLPISDGAQIDSGADPNIAVQGGVELGIGAGSGAFVIDVRVARSTEKLGWSDGSRAMTFDNPTSLFLLVGYRYGDRPIQ